jgi:hypothetical protein
MPEQEVIPLRGEFNCWNGGFDLPDLLLAVCSTGHTGLLRFECAEGEKTLFLRKGEVVFASSSSADDRLGEYLLRGGKITLRDFMRHTHLIRPGKRLGTLLVESGVLDPKGLVQAVIGQVRAIVLSLFRWTEAQYGFDEEDLPSKETITLDMPAARLIMDGLQRIDSWRRISQGVGEFDSVYRRVDGNENALRKLNLDSPSLEVLAILREAKNVTDICDSSPLPDIDVCRYLWAFRCLGWVELADEMQVVSAEPLAPSEESGRGSQAPDADSSPSAPPETVSAEERAGQAADLPTVKTKAVISAPVPDEKASVAPDGSAERESAPSVDSTLDTDDADLEGLGMVLGERKQESETG